MIGEGNNTRLQKKRDSSLNSKTITWPALASLTLSACGGGGGGGPMVQPPPANRAPVAEADKTLTIDEDATNTALEVTTPTDADGNSLTISVTAVPSGGTLATADGTAVTTSSTLTISQLTGLVFTPDANLNDDTTTFGTFTYTVSDGSLTENTRAAYPLDYIPKAVIPSVGGNPKVIIFLTADAMGVLPPLSKLSKNGAMFHFMSGYTSKLAGTERGIKEPKATFSKCFGAPFMPRLASVYAKMLGEKISTHNTAVYLINTGWSGGPYGVGKRIKIEYSRAMVTAVINGSLDIVKFSHNDLFNLDVPTECPGVPSEVLEPRNTWIDKDSYDLSAKKLAQMFVDNFKKFKDVSEEIRSAGPKL